MITLTIVSLSVGILTSIVVAVCAVLGYLKERDKREQITKAYFDIRARFEATQENTQQVKNDVSQAVNLTTQINISEEDRKKIAELLLGAVTATNSTLAITPAPPIGFYDPLFEAIYAQEARKSVLGGKTPSLDKFIKEQGKDKEQK